MRTQMGFEPEEDAQYREQISAAIKRRLLQEIESGRGQSIVNNVYGGGVQGGGAVGGGIREAMADDIDPAARDYYVDIDRMDSDEINPATGKPKGWHKKVHRFSVAHNDDPKKKSSLGTRISDK